MESKQRKCGEKPLTIKQLESMNGQPVWVELIYSDLRKRSPLLAHDVSGWHIITTSKEWSVLGSPYAIAPYPTDEHRKHINKEIMIHCPIDYGETWIAYSKNPTEQ